MKGKAEACRVVEKPVAFKTEADLVNACEWCEQRQVELGQRVKIFPETFNPRIRAQRMMALLWASQALLAESMERNMAYCQNHFREQALSHLRWSHKRAGLNRPYVLPGVLEKLPDIELSELAELAGEGGAGDADVGAVRAVAGCGPCDANEAGCAVGWADAGGVAGEKAGDVVSEFALGGAGAGDARVVGGCGVDGGCACEFAGATHVGEGAGAGKLGSAGDAADVAVAVADAAAGAGVSVDAREEGVR